MKTIDHDPKEPPHRNFPDYDRWVKKDYPNGATPKDFLYRYLPLFITCVGLYFSRHGWPF